MQKNKINKMDEWRPLSWYCPNCGKLITKYRDSDGTASIRCPVCHVAMNCKELGRRHHRFDLFALEYEADEEM